MFKRIVIYIILFFFASIFSSCKTQQTLKNNSKKDLESSVQKQFSYFFQEALRKKHLEEYDQALELLVKCYHINPQDDALMNEFAFIYSAFGKTDYAISYLNEAIKISPQNLWHKINLANLFLSIGDISTATDIYTLAAKEHPKENEVLYNLLEYT